VVLANSSFGGSMRVVYWGWLSLFLWAAVCSAAAQEARASGLPSSVSDVAAGAGTVGALHSLPSSFDEVVDRVIEREHQLLAQMRNLRPMVETYLQNLKADGNGNTFPVKDQYFLGRLDMSNGPEDISFLGHPGFGRSQLSKLTAIYSLRFQPLGFAQMIVPDTDLYKKYYDFTFVRREFLGEVRCLAIDVQPKKDAPAGRFQGRIWVEDQEYNIVRFNGTYSRPPKNSFYLHFDSWRLNMRSGTWLPAYVYSEESDGESGSAHLHLKSPDPAMGLRPASLGKDQQRGVHANSGGFATAGERPERGRG
jgi:hypothetical protein